MNRRAWLYLAGAASVWGASYLFIKVALDDGVSESVIICVRTILGGLVLVPLALRAGAVQDLLDRKRWVLLLATLQVILPFGLITWGERWVPSALAGILVATAPIFVALIAMRIDQDERSHGLGLVGIVIGLLGVGLLFGVDLSGDTNAVLGGLMIVGAALCYAAAAFVVKRRFAGVAPVGVAGSTMVISAVVWLPPALLTLPSEMPTTEASLSLFALGAGGTGLAFFFYYELMDKVGPRRSSIIAYVAPAFAVLYGATLLDEPVTLGTIAGLVLILFGSYLGAEGRLPQRLSRSEPSHSTSPEPARAR